MTLTRINERIAIAGGRPPQLAACFLDVLSPLSAGVASWAPVCLPMIFPRGIGGAMRAILVTMVTSIYRMILYASARFRRHRKGVCQSPRSGGTSRTLFGASARSMAFSAATTAADLVGSRPTINMSATDADHFQTPRSTP